ncbi:MAG: phage head closure protein [Clostridiales bacterium]|nr:phage head closure protein [Clostridiales bacterium]
MTRDGVVTLEVPVYGRDALGQYVKTGTESREVFCEIGNITQSEWGAAGRMGLKPEYRVTVWADEYAGATKAILDGVPYAIYRTYQPSGDKIELYLTRRAGV